jgi:hypothetical protein
MSQPISAAGRVCICEWSGPVTVTMVVSLLSHLKRMRETQDRPLLLVLNLREASASSIVRSPNPFQNALPALWAFCQEIVIANEGGQAMISQLRRALCGSSTTPAALLARPICFFEAVDEAFGHAQGVFPHDVLELQRQRILGGFSSTRNDQRKATSDPSGD